MRKASGAVGVEQLRGADPVFAHDGFDARQGQLQLHRLGRGGDEQAALRGLRLHRVHRHPDVHDGRGGRVRGQIELQQLQKRFGIERRHGQAQGALVGGAVFQLEPQAQLVGGQRAGGQAGGQSVDQARQQEGQRLQQFHRVIQLDFVFETERVFERQQLALGFAAGQFAQAQAFGAEPLGDAQRRQRGQILKAADAPAVQRLLQVGRGGEQRERQRRRETWPRRRRG